MIALRTFLPVLVQVLVVSSLFKHNDDLSTDYKAVQVLGYKYEVHGNLPIMTYSTTGTCSL